MKTQHICALLLASFLSPVVCGEERPFSAGVAISTFGVGPSLSFHPRRDFSVRGFYSIERLKKDGSLEAMPGTIASQIGKESGATELLRGATGNRFTPEASTPLQYEMEARLGGFGLTAEWFPFAPNTLLGGVSLSFGVLYDAAEAQAQSLEQSYYVFGQRLFTKEEVGRIQAEATYRPFSPVLGISWGSRQTTGGIVHPLVGVGVVFLGTPRVRVVSTGSNQNLLALERDRVQQEAEEALRNTKRFFRPVFGVSTSFGF